MFCWNEGDGIEKNSVAGNAYKVVMSSSSDGTNYGVVTTVDPQKKGKRWGYTTISHPDQTYQFPAYTAYYSPKEPQAMLLNDLSADGKLGVGVLYIDKTRGVVGKLSYPPRMNPVFFHPNETLYPDDSLGSFEWDVTKTYRLENILHNGLCCCPFLEEDLKQIQGCPHQTILLGVSPNKKFAVGKMQCSFTFDEHSPLYSNVKVRKWMEPNTAPIVGRNPYGVRVFFLFAYELEPKKFRFLAHSLDYPWLHEDCCELKITDDGKTIVGTFEKTPEDGSDTPSSQAIIWTSEDGPKLLVEWIHEKGTDLPGWDLLAATDMTPDGLCIIGYGKNPEDKVTGYILTRN